ncbi:EAL domain-containing protein [Fulvimarina sp. MAC3]|uniref:EAL domain-containing protein n=1 Tax=Fulvimarina sp. MAC3 TaxID=3148887 RepID=UPI0031FCB957
MSIEIVFRARMVDGYQRKLRLQQLSRRVVKDGCGFKERSTVTETNCGRIAQNGRFATASQFRPSRDSQSQRLKAAGVRISLDDFGTGYSSLSPIQKLPLDKIKVDGSFVHNLADSEASRKIVSSVSALSRDLSLSCVVEDVETREQLDILKGIGCHLIQGYFFSKPMRKTDVAAFLVGQFELRSKIIA